MKAPIQNFYEEITDDENEVYVCNHRINNQPCATQLFRFIHIASYILDDPSYICVDIDDTINTYERPNKKPRFITPDPQSAGKVTTSSSSASSPSAGSLSIIPSSMICEDIQVFCRNCEGFLGYRNETKIQFQFQQLTEIFIMDDDHCVDEFKHEPKTPSRRRP